MSKALFRKALLIFIASVLLITSCKQSDLLPPVVPVNPVSNDAILVTASVSGVILDEKNQPIQGAVVVSGASTTTTNTLGMFSLRDIQLSEQNGSVTITKSGFFTGVRSFKTTAGKDHMVKLQLMQRLLSGTITSSSGGIVNSNNGATINFPVDAFVSNSGSVYNGSVKVYSRWIDPTANNLSFIVPGDLRGLTIAGREDILVTYGMVGAELEDAAGNPLKLSPSKKATVNFPLPASLQGSAPQTIALWHFDNATARWKEEGTAAKSGSTYTALVDKFSFWNCDFGIDFVELDYTLINSVTNTPLIGTSTRLKLSNNLYGYGYGITNNTGFVKGLVPKNAAMVLEVISGDCQTVIYSQNIGPLSSNTSLGNINVIIPATRYINFTGTITNCSGAPVTNGYVSLAGSGGNSGFANTNASGNFSFSILNCTGNNFVYSFMGVDNATTQESTVSTGIASTGSVNLGTLNACSTPSSLNIYISGFQRVSDSTSLLAAKVWKNSAAAILSDVTKNSLANGLFVVGNDVYVAGVEDAASLSSTARLWKNGSVLYTLSNGTTTAEANDVAVSGSDVYVTGSVAGVAKVWKNGIASTLQGSVGKAITIVGNDVYVAGKANNEGMVWKNNVPLFSTGGQYAQFNAIFVSGSDVYAAGTLYTGSEYVATVWKNGVGTTLFNAYLDRSAAYGLFVSGTDVYVAGEEGITNTTAKIWKNGVGTNLTNGAAFAKAVDVVVKNNDVYVLGRSSTSTALIIVLWKNGLPVNITNSSPDAHPTALVVQ